MKKVYLLCLCCITILATILSFNVVSAQGIAVNAPNTIKDIESYISNRAIGFVLKLEDECPIREKLRSFFEKLKDLLKLESSVTPMIEENEPKTFMSHMKSKADNLLQTMLIIGRGLVSFSDRKSSSF